MEKKIPLDDNDLLQIKMEAEVENFKITRIRLKEKEEVEDKVIKETPLTIFLNGEELVTLLCTPCQLIYLAIGFLAGEGFIKKKEDIKDISLDQERGIIKVEVEDSLELVKKSFAKRMITSGCGKGTIFYSINDVLGSSIIQSKMKLHYSEVLNLMREFQNSSLLFKKTGGVHSCALCQDGKILKFQEDLGRHNALDKVLGECFWEGVFTLDKLILTSGRITSEILLKVAKWEIPMIISHGAPTDLAIKLAEKLGLTLVGFVRGEKMNIYTYEERILI